ncbi:hypothetical protein [Salinibacterium sp. ZJ454]|uniref:hypothetical protein n=1 Tax=Salinibacterium sp. ZJ454 TaxID=2708339 RepID=UPI0014207773|nr:hypothetical protein [Salinibacterium sp. ZJ454]
MYISDREPDDFPPPPTVDEVASVFTVPVMSFIPQPSLEERGVVTTGSSSNGGEMTLDSVAISYTLWRNPLDHTDPANLADLSDFEREALDTAPVSPQPDWFMEQRELMRYPMLGEAVMTTRVRDAEWQTPESTLVGHVNYILMNQFREQRVVGGFPGVLDSPVTERHIEPATVPIDEVEVPGMRIDTDPHVYAVGADLGDRILTAVIARDDLSHVTLAFVTRAKLPLAPDSAGSAFTD